MDDGSTDDSFEICQLLTCDDNRFTIVRKENGGLSSARNAGVTASSGDYITFIDADDYVDENYLSELVGMAESSNAELCCTALDVVSPKQIGKTRPISGRIDILNQKDAIVSFLYGEEIEISACGKLYRKDLFHDLSFPEGMLYEDVKFSCDVLRRCCTIAVSSVSHYCYLMNGDSITHTIDERVFDRCRLAFALRSELEKLNDQEISLAAARYCDYHCLSALRSNCVINDTTSRIVSEARRVISQDRLVLLRNKRVPLIDKCGSLLLLFGLKPYRFGWSVFERGRDCLRKYRSFV